MKPIDRSAIQKIVLGAFEESRDQKGAPYEADRLLAFLSLPAPATGKRTRDTFAGRRRYCQFMDSLQLELGICFTDEELNRGFSLSELVDLVEAKLRNPQQAERLAVKRTEEARKALLDEPIKFGLVAGVILALPAVLGSISLRILAVTLWLAVIVATIAMNAKQYRYAQRLVARTSSNAG